MLQMSLAHSGLGDGRAVAAVAGADTADAAVEKTIWSLGPIQLLFQRITDVAWNQAASAWPHWVEVAVVMMYRPLRLFITDPSSFHPYVPPPPDCVQKLWSGLAGDPVFALQVARIWLK